MGLAPMKSTVPCVFCLSLLAAFVGTSVVRLALATSDSGPGSAGAVDVRCYWGVVCGVSRQQDELQVSTASLLLLKIC